MEKQQILRWFRIEESSSPSRVYEPIPYEAGLVFPCLRNGGAVDFPVVQDRRILTEPSLKAHT
jgi:hypothetical protein